MPHKKTLLIMFAALAVAVIAATVGSRGQNQQKKDSPALEKAKEDFYTVTNYDALDPTDPKERARRRVRNNRYKIILSGPNDDPKRFMITERRESSFGLPSSHALDEPAIPAAKSDAVVIGSVTDAQAHLTEDKTDIFSEFRIRLADVLKNTASPLNIGDSITAVRGGGSVQFPSGKTIRYGHHGKPLPHVGRLYVFFLEYNSDGGEDYSIITAYELRAGRVCPLDGLALDGTLILQYAAYQKFKETDEATFLDEVRSAIALTDGQSGGGR